MNVLFLAAEITPYASSGGLGDVIASLPPALRANGEDCRVLIPAYACVKIPRVELAQWTLQFDGRDIPVTLQQYIDAEQELYFLDIPVYFQRDNLYGYEDDILRFGAFCRAALLAQEYFSDCGWETDVTHCHDWHTALFPVYKNILNAPGKVLLTVHNLAYQGVCDAAFMARLGLPETLFNMHQLEFWGQLNPFKGGLVFADAISTVSPTYSKEIQTEAFGCGLQGLLQERQERLVGILNGIDQESWNPQKDTHIKSPFDADNLSGKALCKSHLQKSGGLAIDPSIPLVGMVTRLTAQKGIDLLLSAFDDLMKLDVQLVLLGDGDAALQSQLSQFSERYPAQTWMTLGKFDAPPAHQIYAGSDLFLMPSRFEPCGLAQMISMRYGTVPVVRATGGLADTVRHFSQATKTGNGFVFESTHAQALVESVSEAVLCFKSEQWSVLQQNAFATDFSWRQSALTYEQLYRLL